MVQAFTAFLDFCYLVRQDSLNTDDLIAVRGALHRFRDLRTVFQETGIREPGPKGLSLPRGHAIDHYEELIAEFGAPNGLCSSITESKHIKAVKEPWRRSSRYKALSQMLLTNQRLTKLAGARVNFTDRGMLEGTLLSEAYGSLLANAAPLDKSGLPHEIHDANVVLRREAQADVGAVDGPRILNNVTLAKTKRE